MSDTSTKGPLAMTRDDIASCPFCGDPPVVRRTVQEYPADGEHPAGEYDARVTIDCDTCGISMGEEYRDDAIAAWNRRTPSLKENHP